MASSKGDAFFKTRGGATDSIPWVSSQPLHYLLGWPRDTGFGSGSTAERVARDFDGTGKVAIVTGARRSRRARHLRAPRQCGTWAAAA